MARIVACIVLAFVIISTAANTAEAVTCADVTRDIGACLPYVRGKAPAPGRACCVGVSLLNRQARSKADRQQVCTCLKTLARSLGVGDSYAASIPAKCRVPVPFPISIKTNCATVQ